MNDIFKGRGIEVRIGEQDNFLRIKETLTRIGVASQKNKTLYQSCHILHKQGRYAIIHFKELFELDGKHSDFSEDDKARRNLITKLLSDWELLNIVDKTEITPLASIKQIKILPFAQKNEWSLVSKYSIGIKK